MPFSEQSPGSFANAVRRKTGIEHSHVHWLRHAAACMWLEGGTRLDAVQETLGPASINTTQRYARPMESTILDEMRKGKSVVARLACPAEDRRNFITRL